MKANDIKTIEDLRDFINENEDYDNDGISAAIERNGWKECNDDVYVAIDPKTRTLLSMSDGTARCLDLSEDDLKDYISRYCTVSLEELEAGNKRLRTIDTTSGLNGYPQNLKKALVGFKNFDEAVKMAKANNLSIEVFSQKAGWNLWHRDGQAYQAFDMMREYLDDEQRTIITKDCDFYAEEIKPILSEFSSLDELEANVERWRIIQNELDSLEDDEFILLNQGNFEDVLNKEAMEFSEDSTYYIIGLIQK